MLLAARPILHLYRVIDILDTHLVDGYPARVSVSLDILHSLHNRFFGGHSDVHMRFLTEAISPDMVPKPRNSRILDHSAELGWWP
jgi:hypothetical protein